MAELFLAQDNSSPTHELVVIKRILPYLSTEAEFVQMFLDEARIAAQLDHPNIIQVHELGKLEQAIFIAMEFVEGADVRKMLQEQMKRQGALPYHIAAYIMAEVCAGLDYAHNRIGLDGKPMNIIHRDVSPQNVMVGFNGKVKLVDFGIAKAGALVERSKPGVIKGKFLYLAPEQLAQDRVDYRADLFALGTMLYEITTGKSPFSRPSTEQVILAIRTEDPPAPHLGRPDYPPMLSDIVMRCLAKDRDVRYHHAVEVRADLLEYLRRETPTDARSLSNYVAELMGAEDERTVLHIPSDPVPPPPSSIARRPTPPMVRQVFADLPEPSTVRGIPQRPDTTARVGPPPAPPVPDAPRRYTPIGLGSEPSTTGPILAGAGEATSLEVQAPILADEPPTTAPTAPVFQPVPGPLAPEPKTRPLRPPRAVTGPAPITAAPPPPPGPDRDMERTRPVPGRRWMVWVQENASALVLGTVALVALLVIILLVRSMVTSRPTELPKVSDFEPPAPIVDATQDAGAVASLSPDAAVDPPPNNLSQAVARVMVHFRAPQGAQLSLDGTRYTPGAKVALLPGTHKVVYRCPTRKGRKPVDMVREVKVEPQGGALQEVFLCKSR
jgi:serine/threonine protein kinase